MKVLITGGAGFIGSHLAEALIEKNNSIYIVDNLNTGREGNIPDEAKFYFQTIADKTGLQKIFSEVYPDVVIHAAASYKDPDNWTEDILTNVNGTSNVVKECLRTGCKRLIYFQTSLCYGNPLTSPITLEHPIAPFSSYAISKTAAEKYIILSGLDFVSFRLANCYGPRNLSGPIPTFYQRISNGKPCFVVDTRRDFVFVKDLVKIVVKAVYGTGSKFYHISTGKDFSISEVYSCVANSLNITTKAEERKRGDDDVATLLLDPSRTLQDFNFIPNTPLQEGIDQAVKWYKNNEVRETFTHLKSDNIKD